MNDYVDILFRIQDLYLQKEVELEDKYKTEGTITSTDKEKKEEKKVYLTVEDKQTILSLYEKGYSCDEILKFYKNYSAHSIRKLLSVVDEEEMRIKNKKMAELIPRIVKYKEKGYSDVEVVNIIGIPMDDLKIIYDKGVSLFGKDIFDGKEKDECWRTLGFTFDEADKVNNLLNEGKSVDDIALIMNIPVQVVRKCRTELLGRGIYKGHKKKQTKKGFLDLDDSIYGDIYRKTRYTPRECEYLIRAYEAGRSNESIARDLGKKKGTVDKCKRVLNSYGFGIFRGRPTVYPEGLSIKIFQVDIDNTEVEEIKEIKIEVEVPVSEKKVSDIPMESRTKFIEMKSKGLGNLEIQEALSLSDDDILLLLKECKKFGIQF